MDTSKYHADTDAVHAGDPAAKVAFASAAIRRAGEVAAALRKAPFDVPAGSFRSQDQQLIVRADATAIDASQVADIIIRDSVRVGDVALASLDRQHAAE